VRRRIGAVSHVVLQTMLQRWKMNPNDVQVMQVGSSPKMVVSLDKKGIEAAVLTILSIFVAEDRGYRVLLDMADTDIFYLPTMIGATRNYIKNNRDKVSRFLKGYLEGFAFVKQHRKENIEIVKSKLGIGAEQERNLEWSIELLSTKYYEAMP
jgi:ABC-type nitrate/sulfonate/bicarbonate transport system substrate-binding protein